MAADHWVQRVYAVIEAGNVIDGELHPMQMTPLGGPEDINPEKHYRDERAIANALRDLADRIEEGDHFEGCTLKVGHAS